MNKFWVSYIIICVIYAALTILWFPVRATHNNKLTIVFLITFFVMGIGMLPLVLLTIKGEGVLAGIESANKSIQLVYAPAMISSLVALLILTLTK